MCVVLSDCKKLKKLLNTKIMAVNILMTLLTLLSGIAFVPMGVKLITLVDWKFFDIQEFLMMFVGVIVAIGGLCSFGFTYDGLIEIFQWNLPHLFPW